MIGIFNQERNQSHGRNLKKKLYSTEIFGYHYYSMY